MGNEETVETTINSFPVPSDDIKGVIVGHDTIQGWVVKKEDVTHSDNRIILLGTVPNIKSSQSDHSEQIQQLLNTGRQGENRTQQVFNWKAYTSLSRSRFIKHGAQIYV